jgi:hypothetical protein
MPKKGMKLRGKRMTEGSNDRPSQTRNVENRTVSQRLIGANPNPRAADRAEPRGRREREREREKVVSRRYIYAERASQPNRTPLFGSSASASPFSLSLRGERPIPQRTGPRTPRACCARQWFGPTLGRGRSGCSWRGRSGGCTWERRTERDKKRRRKKGSS